TLMSKSGDCEASGMIGAYWGGVPLADPDNRARRQNDANVSREAGEQHIRFSGNLLLVICFLGKITVQIRCILVDRSQQALRKRWSFSLPPWWYDHS
ncbi:MAG: hypothetical protein KA137_07980, partial [Halioglobus sp.]|nr:hypothetical protein [Halioglobus sp.]